MIKKQIQTLIVAAGSLLFAAAAHAALKPGTYVITIVNSCDTFTLTLNPNKVFVFGVHDLTNCQSPGVYTANGYEASVSKAVIPPNTGKAWVVVAANEPNWLYSLDLVHGLIGVVEGTETGETGYGSATITYTYTPPGAKVPPAHRHGGALFGAH
jgi:hypothetical protein